jgi:hypothetical protein
MRIWAAQLRRDWGAGWIRVDRRRGRWCDAKFCEQKKLRGDISKEQGMPLALARSRSCFKSWALMGQKVVHFNTTVGQARLSSVKWRVTTTKIRWICRCRPYRKLKVVISTWISVKRKTARLQQKPAVTWLSPEFLSVAYSIEGRIANDIAKEIFSNSRKPLAAKGYHTRADGSCDVGYGFSRSMGWLPLVDVLKRQSDSIAKSLRIHKDYSAVKSLKLIPTWLCSWRFLTNPRLRMRRGKTSGSSRWGIYQICRESSYPVPPDCRPWCR